MLLALVITLLKPGKEPTTPKNFRPISLLNLNLKIYAKTLANRLIDILPSLIQMDQTGFTKGHQTSDATRKLINIIHHANTTGAPSLLLFLDAEKAFDRVNWNYLTLVLKKFGFEGHFLHAILALYSTPSARVYTANLLSTPFQIKNGTRQDCPLSPLILNLIMEPLAEHIRSNTKITGIDTGSREHKISLFPDDVILMLTNPSSSLIEVQKTLTWLMVSYYKVNDSKSYILDLGIDAIMRNLLQQTLPYTWADTSISYLSIQLTRSIKTLFQHNYLPLHTKLQQDLQNLDSCEFSWMGRLAAFKMIQLPQVLYIFKTLSIPIPASYFKSKQIQTILGSIESSYRPQGPVTT